MVLSHEVYVGDNETQSRGVTCPSPWQTWDSRPQLLPESCQPGPDGAFLSLFRIEKNGPTSSHTAVWAAAGRPLLRGRHGALPCTSHQRGAGGGAGLLVRPLSQSGRERNRFLVSDGPRLEGTQQWLVLYPISERSFWGAPRHSPVTDIGDVNAGAQGILREGQGPRQQQKGL